MLLPQRQTDRRWALLSTLTAALVAVLLVTMSALFAQSDQTGRSIAKGKEIQRAEELLTAITAGRASLAVATLVADAFVVGRADEIDLENSLIDLAEVASAIEARVETLAELGVPIEVPAIVPLFETLSSELGSGDLEQAQNTITAEVIPALETAERNAAQVRDQAAAFLAAEEGSAGGMARAASVSVALIVPALALVSFRVIQRRTQRQRELELRLEHEVERSKIKDDMIANLSHELRTPLTGIYGAALTMADVGFDDAEFCQEITDIIVGEAADLSRMVDDLLAAAKVEAGDIAILPAPVDPTAIVEEVLVPLVRTREIVRHFDGGIPLADPLRLKQVLRNLISNAIKHGGARVAVTGQVRDEAYLIAVTDDGAGVPAELEARLFDRFIHQGHAALTTGSVGLGLAIANELVTRMDGSLTYSRSNGMTSFIVSLPLASEPMLSVG